MHTVVVSQALHGTEWWNPSGDQRGAQRASTSAAGGGALEPAQSRSAAAGGEGGAGGLQHHMQSKPAAPGPPWTEPPVLYPASLQLRSCTTVTLVLDHKVSERGKGGRGGEGRVNIPQDPMGATGRQA